MSVHYALSYQYFQFMYITCIYLSYHCLGWYTVRIWVFVCVCCAAPDKLTSPPPFTGLGALHILSMEIYVLLTITHVIWCLRDICHAYFIHVICCLSG